MLCLIFVPFYSLYWWYTRGEKVKQEFSQHNYALTGNGTIYLILAIFGLSIVSMAIMQSDFNSLKSETHSEEQSAVIYIMSNPNNKVSGAVALAISTLIGIAIGSVLLWIVSANLLATAIYWVFVALGIFVVISTVPALISSIKGIKEKLGWFSLTLSIISMILGIIMIFEQHYLPVIVGIYLLAFPIIRICLAKDHVSQTRKEAPTLILGILVLLLGFSALVETLVVVGGWVIIALSAIYAILGAINLAKS